MLHILRRRSVSHRISAAGAVYTVPASIPFDGSELVDDEVNAFIDTVPDGSTIEFQPLGEYKQDLAFRVRDRSNLTLDGKGSSFRVGTYGPDDRPNWVSQGGSDITFKNMKTYGNHLAWNAQLLTMTGNPSGGTFTLSWGGETTAPIPWNAQRSTIKDALNALPAVAPSTQFLVSTDQDGQGIHQDSVRIFFIGRPDTTAIALMTADSSGLTPQGTVTVSRITGLKAFDGLRTNRNNHVQHGFGFQSTQGFLLTDFEIYDADGDGVAVYADTRFSNPCKALAGRNGTIQNGTIDSVARTNAIIHGEYITWQDLTLRDIYDAVFDWEPDDNCEIVRNTTVQRCTSYRHHFCFIAIVGSPPPDFAGEHHILNNTMMEYGSTSFQPLLHEPSGGVMRDNLIVRGNHFKANAGEACMIQNLRHGRVENNTWEKVSAADSMAAVILQDCEDVNVGSNTLNGTWAGPVSHTGSTNITTNPGPTPDPTPLGPYVPDTTAPTTTITAPANGATVSGTYVITASLTSPDGNHEKVEFYIDNVLVKTDFGPSYGHSWVTTAATNGSHTIRARGFDIFENYSEHTITVTVSN